MAAKLIIRVHPDDRVDVKVEGLTAVDLAKPPEKRLCRRVSERLEKDLGVVQQRVDAEAPATGVLLAGDTSLQLGVVLQIVVSNSRPLEKLFTINVL